MNEINSSIPSEKQQTFEINPDTRILIGLPTMGAINASLVAHLIKWAKEFPKGVINFYFTYKVQPVDRARNQIVDFFLKRENLTHLFFVDSDTIPPADAVIRLLSQDKDIVTGLTPMLVNDKEKGVWGTFYNAFLPIRDAAGNTVRTECPKENTGLVEVERCGGSCIMIKREVFSKLETPYFKFVLKDNGLDHVVSEDVYFCDRAREAGLKIYADTSIVCNHHKEVML